jgi:hypothetical protein
MLTIEFTTRDVTNVNVILMSLDRPAEKGFPEIKISRPFSLGPHRDSSAKELLTWCANTDRRLGQASNWITRRSTRPGANKHIGFWPVPEGKILDQALIG